MRTLISHILVLSFLAIAVLPVDGFLFSGQYRRRWNGNLRKAHHNLITAGLFAALAACSGGGGTSWLPSQNSPQEQTV